MRFKELYELTKIAGIIKVPAKSFEEIKNWLSPILIKYVTSNNKHSIISKEFKIDLTDFSRYVKNVDLEQLKKTVGREIDKIKVVLYNPNIKKIPIYNEIDNGQGAFYAKRQELVINIKDIDKFTKKENQNRQEYKRFIANVYATLNHELQHWAQLNILRPFITKDLTKSSEMEARGEYQLQPKEFGPLITSIANYFIVKVSENPKLQSDKKAYDKFYKTVIAIIDGKDTTKTFRKLKATSIIKWKKAIKLFNKEIESNKSIIDIINKK